MLEAEIDALLQDHDSIKSGWQQATNQLQLIFGVILENRRNIVLELISRPNLGRFVELSHASLLYVQELPLVQGTN